MKGVWKFTLSLSLGLLTGAAWADEVQWRKAVARPDIPPPVPAQPSPPPAAATPAVSLALPVKNSSIAHTPVVDPNVRRVTLSTVAPTMRGQSPEPPQAMPVGPTIEPLDKMPARVHTDKPAGPVVETVPPGTVVLPHGTTLPPGASLPANVIIAPPPGKTPPPQVVPHAAARPGMVVPEGVPVEGVPVEGMPMEGIPLEGGPVLDPSLGPGETVVGPEGVVSDAYPYPEICDGSPGMACITGESTFEGDCENDCEAMGECFDSHKRFYVSADYLMWWVKGNPTPPLVTRSGDTTGPGAGTGNDPNASVLFGDQDTSRQFRQGGRITGGYWFTPSQSIGIEASFLFLPTTVNKSEDTSGGQPVGLFRPYQNLNGTNESLIIANATHEGFVKIKQDNCLMGGEVNAQGRVLCGSWYRVVLLGGFRYLGMTDSLDILSSSTETGANPVTTTIQDTFKTGNHFFGGQLGGRAELKWGKFVFDFRGKCALGTTCEFVDVSGGTSFSNAQPVAAGLLAQKSNMGKHSTSRFAVVPEGSVNVGYQVTDWWRVYVGYTFLYWSSVARSGDQIDLKIDKDKIPALHPGQTYSYQQRKPMVPFKQTDFWAQGINFGMEFRF